MRVLSDKGYRGNEAVMLIMNGPVEHWLMEKTVSVVEESLTHDEAEDNVLNYSLSCRACCIGRLILRKYFDLCPKSHGSLLDHCILRCINTIEDSHLDTVGRHHHTVTTHQRD